MKITSRCCIGGTDARADRDALRNGGVQIVVGTPGRIKDMIEKKALRTDFIKAIVLDEADEMLSRGFVEEVRSIFENSSLSFLCHYATINFGNHCKIHERPYQNSC